MVSKQVIKVIIQAEETISKAAKQAEKAIKDMGVNGKQGIEGINQASKNAQQTMSKMEKFVKQVQTKFDSLQKSGSNTFDKIKQKIGSAVNSMGRITNVSSTVSQAMEKIKGVSDGVRNKFDSLKNSVSSFGSSSEKTFMEVGNSEQKALTPLQRLGNSVVSVKNKVTGFGASAKNSITSGFGSAVTSASNKLKGLSNSISQARARLNQFSTSARSAGGSLGFLGSAASMTVGMIGYDLVNSFAQSARANINAQSNIDAFGKRIGKSGEEINQFKDKMSELQGTFRKVDMDAVGASALEMGVKLGMSKDSMDDLAQTTAVMSSAFVKEGRTQEDAILAVSDAMDGQFKRLQELGITQDMLKNNGWDGDLENKTGLLQAMNKTLDDMGFTETASQITTLDDAYQAITVSGGQLLSAVLVPITPYLIMIADAFYQVVVKAKGFILAMQEAWDSIPDWALIAGGVTALGIAFGLLGTYIMVTVIPSLTASAIATLNWIATALGANVTAITLSGAFSVLGTTIWSALAPLLPFIAAAALLAVAVFEVGKSFGWWTDVGSMLDAIKAGVMRLWDAFINNPNVKGFIQDLINIWNALCEALQPVIKWAQDVWNELFPPGANFDIVQSVIDIFGGLGRIFGDVVNGIKIMYAKFGLIGAIVGIVTAPINTIVAILRTVICALLGCSPGIVPALERVMDVFGIVWNAIVSILSGIIPSVISAIQPVLNILQLIGNFLLTTFQFAWQTIILVFMTVWTHLQVIISIFSQFLSGQITLQAMLTQIWQVIKSLFFSVLSLIISRVASFAKSLVSKAISAARGFVNAIINRITSLPGRVGTILLGIVARIVSAGVSWASHAASSASSMVQGVISHVSQLPGRVGQEFMNIGSRIMSAGSSLIQKAKNIGKNIVDGLLGAMGIHSPGIIQTKVVTEFKDMVGGVEEQMKPAGEIAKEFGETIVDEFGNPTLNADTSLVQDLDAPQMDMNVGVDTTQLSSANEDVITQYDNLANTTGLSLQNMVSQDKSAFANIKANDTAQMSNITQTVGNKMKQMTNNVKTNMNAIVSKNKQGFVSAKNNTTTQLNNMVSKTKTANSKMIESWKGMSNDVISFAGKIKTQSSQHFEQLGSKIGSFYRKLQNPGGFGAGPATPSGKPSTVRRTGANGFKTIANVIRKYQMPQTMTLGEIRTNPFVSTDNIGSYIIPTNGKFNVADLVRSGNIKIPIGLEDPKNKGAGWLDPLGTHIQKIKSTADKWKMKGPKILGKYPTSVGFKVGDFESGTPRISFPLFKQMAEDVFGQTHYDFYYDNDKHGNWLNAFRLGAMNCYHGALALINFANACGLSGSLVHGHWNKFGHYWANIAGHKMDVTGWQQQRNWTPSASHAGPAPKGLTFGEFVDAIKQTNESEPAIVNGGYDDVEINGNVTVEHIHKFIDLPDSVSAKEVARLINEAPEDDHWLIKLIKKLVKDNDFQKLDLKEKAKIERKNKRAVGV